MKINHIHDLLNTICQYNNVRITQTFTLENKDLIIVCCIPNTMTLELTFLETATVERYNSVEEAATVIDSRLNSKNTL